MKTTPDNEKLLDLVDEARKGKIVLPQFQRNFVWSRDDITALLVSILEGHFIGSFLLLETESDNLPFAVRPLEGVNPNGIKPDRMVLDGQQRLTSLHYAFAAPEIPLRYTKYPYRFFLDLRKVTAQKWDEAIYSDRNDYVTAMLPQSYQFENLIIPLTVVENWNTWLNEYEQWLVERDKDLYFNQYFKIDKPAWNEALDRMRAFLVPTLAIPKIPPNDPDRIAEVCAIFEKMNSKGVRLSVYDLLTARLYKDGIDQHALWEEAVEKYDLLNQFSDGKPDDFGVYVLRTIALMRGLDAKSKSLINLSPKNYEADWRQAVAYMEKALQRLTSIGADGFGVFDPKWMPYSTMTSPLAAMLYAIDHKKFDHQAYKLMRRWYWASVFRERYAGSVESTIYRDYQDWLKAVADPAFEPIAIQEARLSIVENEAFSLRQVSRVNSVYRGIMCLIALRGAKDFQADDSIEFHTLEDHHIFPKAYLYKQKSADGKPIPPDRVNSIVNRTLISAQTNRRISRSSPSNYLERLVPADHCAEIMRSHFIDADGLAAMQTDNFEAFLDARELSLMTEVVTRLGV
ncbi:MAG: DUF262 domain-containing protein [Anaerolineales bacterium]|nr:DUF262 domain-containing protein [Anaerolineales bacterium]